MNLYLFKTMAPREYDTYGGFVVRAKSLHAASGMVRDEVSHSHDAASWEPPYVRTTLLALFVSGEPEIVLESYSAG